MGLHDTPDTPYNYASSYLAANSDSPEVANARRPQSPPRTAIDETFDKWDVDDRVSDRRGIGKGLIKLSKGGLLTGDRMKEARARAIAAGVSPAQFASFLKKHRVRQNSTDPTSDAPYVEGTATDPTAMARASSGSGGFGSSSPSNFGSSSPSNFGSSSPSNFDSSPEEASQNVVNQNNFGSGLSTDEARQSKNFITGSGNSFTGGATRLNGGRTSGAFRREARYLRKHGYGAAAQQMAVEGSRARMSEPVIDTPALKSQRASQRIITGRAARAEDERAAAFDKRADDLERKKRMHKINLV